MKASYEALQPSSHHSFLVRAFENETFDAPYHFHPEYELTLILQGEGTRYVGSNMGDFRAGDLVLLGTNLPHCWKLEPSERKDGSAIVIQFTHDFLGAGFFSRPELRPVQGLLRQSGGGLQFVGDSCTVVQEKMKALAAENNNFRRLLLLLEILQQLSAPAGYRLLDPQKKTAEQSRTDRERINAVLAYLVENFRRQVSLEEAAAASKMTSHAFCKYFKKITRKTFMETVIEYRLHYAAQQLVQTDHPVSQICFDSGFGDISHFNKMFKSKMQHSPLNYRKKFMREA